ncbi:MAG: SDR family oxidoreductase [Alphaproteobacteria bacterium]
MATGAAPRLFVFGLGYSAQVFARRLRARGWRIAGTTRNPEAATALRGEGVEALLFDRDRPLAEPAAALAGTTHLLASVPPDQDGDPVLALHGPDIAACASLAWAGYLSTTGVYGDRRGDWVDEDSALAPTSARATQRVVAERAWLELHGIHGLPVHIFRLAGIYGPGRSALDQARAGTAKRIDKPGQVFSRIHVDDIATVLEASIARAHPGRAYNLCDDNPAPPAEVVVQACALLGLEPPPLVPYEAAGLSALARSFYRDNKRVSNRRIKEELGVTLAYPDYETGLRAILAEAGAS